VAGAVVISANDHVLEPPHLWLDHLPARYRDRAPHVVDQPDGGQAWIFGDQVVPVSRLAACAGEDPDTFRMGAPARYDDLRKGVYDPLARVADMDQDGVERHACLPSMIGFGGTRLLQFDDRDLALACIRAYNDFIIDEWCGAAPERFISVALLPQWDVAVAAGEAERVVGKGVHAVAFVEDPTSLGFPSWHGRYWNPALAVVHEAGIPLCLHMQTVPIRMVPGPDTPFGVDLTLMYCTSMATMVNLLFSPVFLDFPELKVILAEGGLGWIPFMLEKADFLWDRHRLYARNPLIERPGCTRDTSTERSRATTTLGSESVTPSASARSCGSATTRTPTPPSRRAPTSWAPSCGTSRRSSASPSWAATPGGSSGSATDRLTPSPFTLV
jgi:predicted TIM-barrel fold metal-dependent hydrolase